MGVGFGSESVVAVRTLDDVAIEDARYRATDAKTVKPAPSVEGAAMKKLLQSNDVCQKCVRVVGESRWLSSQDTRTRVLGIDDETLGMRVAKTVEDLDAPHLRPTSITQRLDNGVDNSCHSLITLLANVG